MIESCHHFTVLVIILKYYSHPQSIRDFSSLSIFSQLYAIFCPFTNLMTFTLRIALINFIIVLLFSQANFSQREEISEENFHTTATRLFSIDPIFTSNSIFLNYLFKRKKIPREDRRGELPNVCRNQVM